MDSRAPRIRAVGRALPQNYVEQAKLIAAFRGLWEREHFNGDRIEQLHRAVGVQGRHLALPLEQYEALTGFGERNAAWLEAAKETGGAALRAGLERAGLAPQAVDHLLFVTVTGIAVPSLDARLMNRLPLRRDLKRTPIFGLGCAAGASAIARAADTLRGDPGGVAAVLSVELCSLTLQRDDLSVANLISSGLFGDGAAAVVLEGGARPGAAGPRVVASRAVFYPDTERVMGWDVGEGGLKVVLAATVPALVREHLRGDVDAFLADCGLSRRDVRHWVAHTGGPKVLQAMQEALELPPGALERSWRSLRQIGNLSSASVLFVLGELLDSGEPAPGDWGLLLAMGPGFCAELVLLRW